MERALVTGGAGFIGSHIVDALIKNKIQVMIVDNMSSGKEANISKHFGIETFNISYMDIQNPDLEMIYKNFKPDVVFHLAARPGVAFSVENPRISDLSNINGTVHLLELAKKYKTQKFIFSSSSSVYGGSEILPTPEDTPLNPKSPYALQKKVGEDYCKLFSTQYGVNTVCLRYFNIFGSRQSGSSSYSAVIAAFLHANKQGNSPKIYGDGEQFRDFTPVDNVVHANLQAAFSSQFFNGTAFNIGCGRKTSINELVKIMNCKEPVRMDSRPGDVKCSQADIQKAKELLGYRIIKNFDDAIFELQIKEA